MVTNPSSKRWLWCDKIKAIREVGKKVLYVDADLVPARCLSHLPEPSQLSLFEDAVCVSCNIFNAGLVWVPQLDTATSNFFIDWENTCRTNPLATKNNLPDDQVALDIIVNSNKHPTIPLKLPYHKVRYMNAALWAWVTDPVFWHYTHTARNYCTNLNL
eukprot:TRINITY_DN8688_c0_g1_i1.p1 TRINITY_DN8688_c0_g1~~TRINITY_DN8688_c0_g1_i1.p1  ORF type:complete len:159 (+),score=23.12 TRINITY_DN8688_c0_g1_i1:376-852(+)